MEVRVLVSLDLEWRSGSGSEVSEGRRRERGLKEESLQDYSNEAEQNIDEMQASWVALWALRKAKGERRRMEEREREQERRVRRRGGRRELD